MCRTGRHKTFVQDAGLLLVEAGFSAAKHQNTRRRAEPRGCPCRPRASQRVRGRCGLGLVWALIRWATGKRLASRLPKLSVMTLPPFWTGGSLVFVWGRTCQVRSSWQSLGTQGEWFIRFFRKFTFLEKAFSWWTWDSNSRPTTHGLSSTPFGATRKRLTNRVPKRSLITQGWNWPHTFCTKVLCRPVLHITKGRVKPNKMRDKRDGVHRGREGSHGLPRKSFFQCETSFELSSNDYDYNVINTSYQKVTFWLWGRPRWALFFFFFHRALN